MSAIRLLQAWVPATVFKPEFGQLVYVGIVPKVLFLHGQVAGLHLRIIVLVVKEGQPGCNPAAVTVTAANKVVLVRAT
jgi:hypothetical protein